MPAYHVTRSIIIKRPLKEVHHMLRDYKQWPIWSPWLVMEPDATVTYSQRQGQVGANYGWSGLLVGSGSMELMEVHESELKMQLRLSQPYQSKAKVGFILEELAESTQVVWYMDGYLPFYMFWMRYRIKTYIGMDYERGLNMLKEYLEKGSVASYVHIEGVMALPQQQYIGIPRLCKIKDLGKVMKEDFERLYTFMEKNNISQERIPFTIYNTFDIFKGETSYVVCIPLSEEITMPKGWVRGKLPQRNTLKTMHKGRYLHLGNGWMTAMSFARIKKMKLRKSPVGYEFYPNKPYETSEEAYITEIYLPLK